MFRIAYDLLRKNLSPIYIIALRDICSHEQEAIKFSFDHALQQQKQALPLFKCTRDNFQISEKLVVRIENLGKLTGLSPM